MMNRSMPVGNADPGINPKQFGLPIIQSLQDHMSEGLSHCCTISPVVSLVASIQPGGSL